MTSGKQDSSIKLEVRLIAKTNMYGQKMFDEFGASKRYRMAVVVEVLFERTKLKVVHENGCSDHKKTALITDWRRKEP